MIKELEITDEYKWKNPPPPRKHTTEKVVDITDECVMGVESVVLVFSDPISKSFLNMRLIIKGLEEKDHDSTIKQDHAFIFKISRDGKPSQLLRVFENFAGQLGFTEDSFSDVIKESLLVTT